MIGLSYKYFLIIINTYIKLNISPYLYILTKIYLMQSD